MKIVLKVISAILLMLSVYLIISGGIDIMEANKMPVSAGLGAYTHWMGGLIQIGIALVLFVITGLIIARPINKYISQIRTEKN
jgi:TRAP-type C4-dicarboxylate transport system permease small subunit